MTFCFRCLGMEMICTWLQEQIPMEDSGQSKQLSFPLDSWIFCVIQYGYFPGGCFFISMIFYNHGFFNGFIE